MEEHEALHGVRLRSAQSLLQEFAHTDVLGEAAWERVLRGLRERSCGVLPALLPPSGQKLAVVFPLSPDGFGRILEAARQTAETGTRQAADELAHAARSLHSLTTVPRHRHYRAEPPPAGASSRSRLDHRVGAEGDGYLPMPADEALAALDLRGRAPRPRDGIFPLPPYAAPGAWVVVRRNVHSAPGIVLTGVQAAYTHRDGIGAEQLMSCLGTASAALQPAPARLEWGD